MVESDFIRGAKLILEVADVQTQEACTRDLHMGLALIANAYHERLIRAANRIEAEEDVIEHLKQFLPPTLYPGDMRAEKEPLK
jgi:hypothetical protein